MGICIACGKSCPPHRFAGRPCDSHANNVCCDCWKKHLYIEVIINKTTAITCAQCNKMIDEAQFKEGAKVTQEYFVTLKAVAVTLDGAPDQADAAKAVKSSMKENTIDGDQQQRGVRKMAKRDKIKEDDFVYVDKDDVSVDQDDWQVIGKDDL
ncbi:hypothetical protein Slin15195_G089930 [Septoria linicola]|uniref:Uncharacterized protein n=1 Tax=Septoria linicola TaxID=215465 RepID=A0A9Q9AVK8_9PEZI|nr:hypothetical protein Slin14017_G125540 [Septoria linicola]USW55674.1 hypothetical protein Slin15195_G089930 [Septoria linicola]